MWYSSREKVKLALDLMETTRSDWQIDAALGTATNLVDQASNRPSEALMPTLRTLYFDYPQQSYGGIRVYFGPYILWTLVNVKVGGTTVDTGDIKFYPQEGPHLWMELDLSKDGSFSALSTYQQGVSVTARWGSSITARPIAGALAAEVGNSTDTTITVNGQASAVLGVGDLIRIDNERLEVTGRTAVTTSQTLQTPMTANISNRTVAVTTGSAYSVGEVILLDSERMRIMDVAGNTLSVQRAVDGTVLATHTGSTVYAYRKLNVLRGARGSTAATHDNAKTVDSWLVPPELESLCRAEALQILLQEQTGYSGSMATSGNKSAPIGTGLPGLREQVSSIWGYKSFHRVV